MRARQSTSGCGCAGATRRHDCPAAPRRPNAQASARRSRHRNPCGRLQRGVGREGRAIAAAAQAWPVASSALMQSSSAPDRCDPASAQVARLRVVRQHRDRFDAPVRQPAAVGTTAAGPQPRTLEQAAGTPAACSWFLSRRTNGIYRVDALKQPHYVVPVGADREIGLKREAGADMLIGEHSPKPALPRSGMGNERRHGTGVLPWEATASR